MSDAFIEDDFCMPEAGKTLCIGIDNVQIDVFYPGHEFYDEKTDTSIETFWFELTTAGEGMTFKVHVPVKDLKYIIQNLQNFQKEIEDYKESNNG